MTTDYIWLEPILIFFLILANGFFAASEIAMIAMRKSRIDALVERGVRSAAVVARLKADPDRFLATVQIGVTVISTFASAIGGAAASGYLKPQIAALPFLRGTMGRSHCASHRGLADSVSVARSWRAGAQVPCTSIFGADRLLCRSPDRFCRPDHLCCREGSDRIE